jgi:hypothetical protein
VIHVVYGLLFAVFVGALAWLSVGSLVLLNRLHPEKPPLVDGHGPDAPGPGWREAELPELDPVVLAALLEEARGITAAP